MNKATATASPIQPRSNQEGVSGTSQTTSAATSETRIIQMEMPYPMRSSARKSALRDVSQPSSRQTSFRKSQRPESAASVQA